MPAPSKREPRAAAPPCARRALSPRRDKRIRIPNSLTNYNFPNSMRRADHSDRSRMPKGWYFTNAVRNALSAGTARRPPNLHSGPVRKIGRVPLPLFLFFPPASRKPAVNFVKKGLPNRQSHAIIPSVSKAGRITMDIGMSPSGKAPDFDSGIRRFKSCHPSQFDPLAQLAEQLPFKQWVRGSNPRRVTKNTPKPQGLGCFLFGFFVFLIGRFFLSVICR